MKQIIDEHNDYHNRFVDVLKGICIVFIIITHLPWSDEQRLYYLFPYWINMAVPIFMIISGYVYALSYKRNQVTSIGDAYSIKNVISKIIRYTLPFVLFFVIEVSLLVLTDSYTFPIGEAMTLGQFFLQGGLGPGSYYYPIMVQFIFIFPLIYFVVEKYQFRGVVLVGGANACYELLQWAYLMNVETYRLLVFRYLLLIAAGCYIASDSFQMKRNISIAMTIVGFGFILNYHYLHYQPKIVFIGHRHRLLLVYILFRYPCF